MPKTYEVANIPKAKLAETENMLKQDGAKNIKHRLEENGLYRIIATYPDTKKQANQSDNMDTP